MKKETKTLDLMKTCMFLRLTLSRLGDKRGVSSDEIEVDADKTFVKVRKVIFKSPHFDRIRSLDGEIRRWVRDACLPFDPGIHLVPMKLADKIDDQLQGFYLLRQEYIQEFAEVLPTLISKMPELLRKLYKEEDYQDLSTIHDEFYMSWNFFTFTSPLELEDISPQVFKQEKDKWANRMEEAFYEARMVLRETCLELIRHLRERLEPDMHRTPKRLSASTVNHLREFLDVFELKNVTDDKALQDYVSQAKKILGDTDVEALREVDQLRSSMGRELKIIEEAIDHSIQSMPERRLRIS